jgi:succinate dehydrogenase/fumarate reductase-like Fe-S protein
MRLLTAAAPNARFHSQLYGYFRVTGHLASSNMAAYESVDSSSGNQYITEMKIPSVSDSKVSPAHPGMISWHSFKIVHPTVVDQFMELTDCVLCGSCTASCPSYWWNNDIYYGPAAMVQAWRWLWEQHNDKATFERKVKEFTNGPVTVEFCHNIGNCVLVCPKSINVDRVMRGFSLLASLN